MVYYPTREQTRVGYRKRLRVAGRQHWVRRAAARLFSLEPWALFLCEFLDPPLLNGVFDTADEAMGALKTMAAIAEDNGG